MVCQSIIVKIGAKHIFKFKFKDFSRDQVHIKFLILLKIFTFQRTIEIKS